MKKLLTATIILSLSGTVFAQGAEVPEDTIPGYGVEISQASNQRMVITSELRAEPLALTVPGYGVQYGMSSQFATDGRLGNQPGIGQFEVDYLGMSYQGAN